MDNLKVTAREKISPPLNINVANDYMGVDRGLFSIVSGQSMYYARITSASYRSNGPVLAPGYLTFKIEMFEDYPLTTEDYAAAIKLDDVYITYSSGSKAVPILIEYWCKTTYLNVYANKQNVEALDPGLIAGIKDLGNSYTRVLLGENDPRTITVNSEYASTSTSPLSMVSYKITVHEEGKADVVHVIPVETVTPVFDPVNYIKGL